MVKFDYFAREKRKDSEDEKLISWLPEALQQQVVRILQGGRRVPEEVLGPKEFQALWQEMQP